MASTTKTVTIHDRCCVAPPHSGEVAAEQSLPLTFFDMLWLHFHPIKRLLFYPSSCSASNFLETVVPSLKQSLSVALINYLPIAGNLIYPLESGMPEIRYVSGDSVSLTIAEASEDFDFNYLTGNQAREANEFYPFVPELPEPKIEPESGFRIIPLIAIQITLFPGTGICIGFTNHHVIGDASSIVGFINAWSKVAKVGGQNDFLVKNDLIPIYDRSLIKDPSGHRANIFWNQMKLYPYGSPVSSFPNNKLRSTFILQKDEIQILKNLVLERKPGFVRLSSFTVITAYVWSCLVKSAKKSGENVDENEPEYFGFAVDARRRLEPPLPAAYFGNCLGEADEWLVKYGPLLTKRVMGVAGSPRFDMYDTDFGWGKPKKYEAVSIDGDGSMSLSKSGEFEGGLEIGLSLPIDVYDADFGWGKLKKIEAVSTDGDKYSVSLVKREFEGGLEIGMSLPGKLMDAFVPYIKPATNYRVVTIHHRCSVAPPDSGEVAAEQSLPLTFFDMIWLHFHPIQRVIFYPFPCSISNFLETIVPNLKLSLSTTLINYLPMAGNLYYPLLDSGMPEIRYVRGDSVSVTIAEASEASDFNT
ncbi:hypothetical protein BUALT_Bualt01G0213800 [Buddleja alternifolia]|uniref:Uncharacterized protein n=1 Tax=Buddleja alternifolia TaxID=168488 RepID=A0AAV6YBB2_9LAMI|nr:hypothetical protein BUALT_Bualt01G0213800 [Buddleja alternifolia]